MERGDNGNGNAINAIVGKIDPSAKNNCGPIIINEIKKELLILQKPVNVSKQHVSRLDYATLIPFVETMSEIIPEYLTGHTLLKNQIPAAETHSLQFVKEIKSKVYSYIHMLKIDLRFGSGIGTSRGGGSTEYYQEYDSDGLIVSSQVIPIKSADYVDECISDFMPVRVVKKESIEQGDRMLVHTFFDDFDATEINADIWHAVGDGIFPFSAKIYPFVSYAHFTSCMNLPDAVPSALETAVRLYEPIFLLVLSHLGISDIKKAVEEYPDSLIIKGSALAFTESFANEIKQFFSRYSLFQDDDFMIKRWRRLDVAH